MTIINRSILCLSMICLLGGAFECRSQSIPVQSSDDSRTRLAGTWRYATSDASTSQKITLVLRSDGSYTKTLEARVNGANYGGTHSGTWTAEGMVVHLSGDGNWPAYTHDLSTFAKDR